MLIASIIVGTILGIILIGDIVGLGIIFKKEK